MTVRVATLPRLVLISALVALAVYAVVPPEPSAGPRDPARASAALYAKGDLVGASEVLQRAVRHDPEDAQLRFMLANALFRLRDWRGAIEQYREAAHLRPAHPDTHLSLGFAHYRLREYAAAVAAWRRAVATSRPDALPHLGLALGLQALGNHVHARREVRRAVTLDPAWAERLQIDIRWTRTMTRTLERLVSARNLATMEARHGNSPGT